MTLKSLVVVRDLGFDSVMKALRTLDNKSVAVGVRGDTIRDDGQTPLVLVATVNEFGSADGNIPERSFIRSTLDDEREAIGDIEEQAVRLVAETRIRPFDALHIVGQFVRARIQDKIVSLSEPPNAPSTVRKKGSSNPLIDTGQLLQGIDYVVGKSLSAGSSDEDGSEVI